MPTKPTYHGFVSSSAGVDSGIHRELLQENQLSWGFNIKNRYGKPSTRPRFVAQAKLPFTQVQNVTPLKDNRALVVSGGVIYLIQLTNSSVNTTQISGGNLNPEVDYVSSVTAQDVVIFQDGISNPLVFDSVDNSLSQYRFSLLFV